MLKKIKELTIDQLLNAHEWTDIEFKEAQNAVPKSAYETISAFANTAGGYLVFGVKKDGQSFEVVGVKDVDKIQNDFVNTLRQKEKFSLILDVTAQLQRFEDKDVLIFIVPEASKTDKPVYINGDIRRSFLRKGACDVRCSPEELQRLLNDASEIRYDTRILDYNLNECFVDKDIQWY